MSHNFFYLGEVFLNVGLKRHEFVMSSDDILPFLLSLTVLILLQLLLHPIDLQPFQLHPTWFTRTEVLADVRLLFWTLKKTSVQIDNYLHVKKLAAHFIFQ